MKSPKLAVLTQEHYERWFEGCFKRLHHRSPFHHPAWLQAAGSGVNFDLRFVGIYDGKDLVAALPGFLTRRGPIRLFGSPLRGTMTSYLGPVGSNLDTGTDLVDLVRSCCEFACRQWGASYARFTLRAAPAGMEAELGANWEQQHPRSYRLDLSPGTVALWDRLKSDCRRNIRRAQQQGIEIVPMRDAHLFFEILEETFRRHGTSSWQPERFFELVMAGLIPRDLLWAWGAKYQGKTVAVGLFVHDDQEMHFISGASLPEYGSLPTSYLLHWHAIETAVAAGLRIYNSDASQVRSIDQFKESFRPSLDERCSLIWAPSHVRYALQFFMAAYPRFQRMKNWLQPRGVGGMGADRKRCEESVTTAANSAAVE